MNRSLPDIRTKLCGIRSYDHAAAAIAGGGGAIGLNCYRKSKRYCPLPTAAAIADEFRDRLTIVALAVNASPAEIVEICESIRPDILQLHGDEPMPQLAEIARSVSLPPILRAIRWPHTSQSDRRWLEDWLKPDRRLSVAGFLLDAAAAEGWGGSGVRIDVATLSDVDEQLEGAAWMLAGGLTPSNVEAAVASTSCVAVDVASGIEAASTPDAELMRRFVQAAERGFAARSESDDAA